MNSTLERPLTAARRRRLLAFALAEARRRDDWEVEGLPTPSEPRPLGGASRAEEDAVLVEVGVGCPAHRVAARCFVCGWYMRPASSTLRKPHQRPRSCEPLAVPGGIRPPRSQRCNLAQNRCPA